MRKNFDTMRVVWWVIYIALGTLLIWGLSSCAPADGYASPPVDRPVLVSEGLPRDLEKFIDGDVVCYVYKRASGSYAWGGISCLPCYVRYEDETLEACK